MASSNKNGRSRRKTILKIVLGAIGCLVLGSILYAVFSDTSRMLSQAKVEIDLGAERVEAYANIQVEANGKCEEPPQKKPSFSISLPSFDFLGPCWSEACRFSWDCITGSWRGIVDSFKGAMKALADLWFALINVLDCFSFLWCPFVALLLGIRDMLLCTFEAIRNFICASLWFLVESVGLAAESIECHLMKDEKRGCESQFLLNSFASIEGYKRYAESMGAGGGESQLDALTDLLTNLLVSACVVGFFILAEHFLDWLDKSEGQFPRRPVVLTSRVLSSSESTSGSGTESDTSTSSESDAPAPAPVKTGKSASAEKPAETEKPAKPAKTEKPAETTVRIKV